MVTETTFNGMRGIVVNSEVYFSPSDYNKQVPEELRWGFDVSTRRSYLPYANGSQTSISVDASADVQIYNGDTYIHTKYYISAVKG